MGQRFVDYIKELGRFWFTLAFLEFFAFWYLLDGEWHAPWPRNDRSP